MRPVAHTTSGTSADDPVRAAVQDDEVLARLSRSAHGLVGRWFAHLPYAERADLSRETVQEVVARALDRCMQYRTDEGDVGAWLYGILINTLRDRCRRLSRQPRQAPADASEWEQLAVELTGWRAETVDGRLDVEQCLQRLPAEHRELLVMKYLDDLDGEQIAARLGISVGAARVRLCRALKAAKDQLGTHSEEGCR